MVDELETSVIGPVDGGNRDQQRHDYSPSSVDGWLYRWAELAELAIPTCGSTSNIDPQPGTPKGGLKVVDPLKLCRVRADIMNAWANLGPETQAFKLIYLVMQIQMDPEVDATWGRGNETVQRACWWNRVVGQGRLLGLVPLATNRVYGNALKAMALSLGWKTDREIGRFDTLTSRAF